MAKIKLTFPNGSVNEYDAGITAFEIAKQISNSLAEAAVAAKVDEQLIDLTAPIKKNGRFEVITSKSKEGLEVLRHSTAHLLAHAVKRLFPKAVPTIGPVVEEGFYYDFDSKPFTPEDLVKIEAEMAKIVAEKIDIKRLELTKSEAKKVFKDNPYKLELIDEFEGNISAYGQGDFMDLCRGPHLPNTSKIKAFKITKLAGAYWRGDANNKQLQRIYGIAFFSKKELDDYLKLIEEAEKRDHRKIGKELELYFFHEYSPGSAFFEPKGAVIYNELMKYIREQYFIRGYKEVVTPLLYDKALWETSGHWEHYKDDMFKLTIDGREFSLKPMNCPSHLLIFKNRTRSYKELPLRIADFAPLHRNELKGVLSGLTRVRKFCQDDSHIFCTEEQIAPELLGLIDFVDFIYKETFNFEYNAVLSTRPEKFMGDVKLWDKAEKVLEEVLKKRKILYRLAPGEGAFYGPKIDFKIKDALGRDWQLATIQVDFQMPLRFEATYEGEDGKKHTPIMLHRALLGSVDRFIGVYTESCAGKFPLWLSPVQVKILSISDRHVDYAKKVIQMFMDEGIRTELDDRAETIPKKVRQAEMEKVPYILVIGDKEMQNETVNVRTRDNVVHGEKKAKEFLEQVKKEIKERKL